MASIEMNLNAYPVKYVLPLLLIDHTTKKNIIFATDSYADQGEEYSAKNHITEEALKVLDIQPRVLKNAEEQVLRTRKKAEVFTPAWVCCLMNNFADEVWFGRPEVFGLLNDTVWTPLSEPIKLPKRRRWQTYVDARRLEITCGEAPYLVSRYDMGTGEVIPIECRVGMLDRKLRIVNENAESEAEWLRWAIRSLQAVYGYEYQGDNLLIARVNLLLTFVEYLKARWGRDATLKEVQEAAKVVSWNIWQMDGLKGTIPMGALYEQFHQMSLFEMLGAEMGVDDEVSESIPSRIFDWRGQKKSIEYNAFREGRSGSMKFDFIIGNPPYQEEIQNQGDRANPVYDKFMDATYDIADCVELIHPARFLFDAGQTSKAWNRRMLDDTHFMVLKYWNDASTVFSGVDIKGGVAVTIHDNSKELGPIGTFTSYEELNCILKKVISFVNGQPMLDYLVSSRGLYRFSERFYEDFPDASSLVGKGSGNMIVSNIFDKASDAFVSEPNGIDDYVRILGRSRNTRVYKLLKRSYLIQNEYLDAYKVMLPEANGTGQLGEIISSPFVANPGEGATDTFISIGHFDNIDEANSLLSYIKTKFVRAMLAVNKVTQHNPKSVWRSIPLQDFTANSDINWSVSIKAIDQQLYKKYGLSDEEITFIETHVKEMS